jgi:hypothetical protein
MSDRKTNSLRNSGSCSWFYKSAVLALTFPLKKTGISLLKAKNRSRHFPALSHLTSEWRSRSPYDDYICCKKLAEFTTKKCFISTPNQICDFHNCFHNITLFYWFFT